MNAIAILKPPSTGKLVDEAGRLLSWYNRVGKRKVDRLTALKQAIAARAAADKEVDEPATYLGLLYTASVTSAANAREIVNMQGVYDELGHDVFLAKATLAFKILDALVGETEAIDMGLVTKERTGPRSVTLQPREPKAAA